MPTRNHFDLFLAADQPRIEADAELFLFAGLGQLPLIRAGFPDPDELESRLRQLSLNWDTRPGLLEQDPCTGG